MSNNIINIEKLRLDLDLRNYSQTKLAKNMNFTRATVSQYINSEIDIYYERLRGISEFLDLPFSENEVFIEAPI